MTAWAWHVHHDVLLEPLTEPIENRIAFIKADKPKEEIETRLRLLKPVKGRLPVKLVQAWEAVGKAREAYVKAGKAYDKAGKAYDKAGKAYDKAWKEGLRQGAGGPGSPRPAREGVPRVPVGREDDLPMSDIHVAPCGCELHVRIRELEAELVIWIQKAGKIDNRAFIAEARAEKAEARVAELEMFVRGLYNCYNGPVEDRTRRMDHIFAASGVKPGRSAEVVGWGVEAREREASE